MANFRRSSVGQPKTISWTTSNWNILQHAAWKWPWNWFHFTNSWRGRRCSPFDGKFISICNGSAVMFACTFTVWWLQTQSPTNSYQLSFDCDSDNPIMMFIFQPPAVFYCLSASSILFFNEQKCKLTGFASVEAVQAREKWEDAKKAGESETDAYWTLECVFISTQSIYHYHLSLYSCRDHSSGCHQEAINLNHNNGSLIILGPLRY